jgi:hypothetical protein
MTDPRDEWNGSRIVAACIAGRAVLVNVDLAINDMSNIAGAVRGLMIN